MFSIFYYNNFQDIDKLNFRLKIPHTYHLYSTINILVYFLYHTCSHLSIPQCIYQSNLVVHIKVSCNINTLILNSSIWFSFRFLYFLFLEGPFVPLSYLSGHFWCFLAHHSPFQFLLLFLTYLTYLLYNNQGNTN